MFSPSPADQEPQSASTPLTAALYAHREFIQAFLQNLPNGAAFVVDHDLRYQYAGGEALASVGKTPADFVGKTIFEALDPDIAAAYEPMYRQGLAGQSFILEHPFNDHFFQTKGVPLREADAVYAVLVLSYNITERKRHEANVALLNEIGNDLTTLPTPDEIMETVGARVGQFLGLSGCLFFDVDETHGKVTVNHGWTSQNVPIVKQTFRINEYMTPEFVQANRAGNVFIIHNTSCDERINPQVYSQLQAGSFVAIPFHWQGRWTAYTAVSTTEPRNWQADEIGLLQEISNRLFPRLERAKSEEALRNSEARLRTLLQNLPDYAIFRLDANGVINEWTTGAQQITGYSAAEAIGQHLSLLYPPKDVAAGEVDEELAEVARTGRIEREGQRVRKNGELFFINEIATAIYNKQGQLSGFAKISRDITARKADQEQLRILEERTRIAVEAADMATWEWHLLTNEVYWNEQHFRLFGMELQPQPLTPDAFSRHVHPDDREWVIAELNRAIREKTPYDAEFRALREDNGEVVWMSGYGRITAEVDGQPSRVNGVMYDVTERRQAEEELRDSQQRLQIILDSIADHAIITFDADTLITSWNGGAEQLFGHPADEAIGQSVALIFTAEDRATGELEKEMQLARRDGQTPDERDHLRKDGSKVYISGVLSPLYTADGQLLGYVKVARDLTERRRMEQALRQTDRRKDEFLAMLAHELRNPLAPIRNGIQFLGLTHANDPTLGPLLPVMNRQMDHLVRLVDDLLDVSRISWGKIELRIERLDLTKVVGQVVQTMRPLYASSDRQLSVDLPNFSLYMNGDATRLNQVVNNLLTNGVRYTRENGEVWLSLEQVGSEAILRVRDNGIGLAADQLEAIFELFVQVDNSLARANGGLGLGLTLVQQLVQMHGGRVEARSPGLNQGSEFVVYLPIL